MFSLPIFLILCFLCTLHALDTVCLQHATSLPDFDQAANASLPKNWTKRCPSCPLGLALDETLDTDGGFMYGADFSRFHHLLRRLSHGRAENLTIGVLGGSMAIGHIDVKELKLFPGYCQENCTLVYGDFIYHCPKCVYLNRFAYWLQKAYPKVDVQFRNYAIPATTSQSIISLLGPEFYKENLDVILIHYGDNDRNFDERDPDVISSAFERLYRMLINLPTNPVVINLELYVTVIDRKCSKKSCMGIFAGHMDVLKYYQVPTLNYDLSALKEFGIHERHPAWPFHQMIADYLAYAWKKEAIRSCGYKPKQPLQLQQISSSASAAAPKYCSHPLSHYHSDRDENGKAVEISGGGWEFVAGKGWSTTQSSSASSTIIMFPLQISKRQPNIVISYMKSSSMGGSVKVHFKDSPTAAITLTAAYHDPPQHNYDLIHSQQLCIEDGGGSSDGDGEEKTSLSRSLLCRELKKQEQQQDGSQEEQQQTETVYLQIESMSTEKSEGKNYKFVIVEVLSC